MSKALASVLGLLLALPIVATAQAQPASLEQRLEEEIAMALSPTERAILRAEQRLAFDYGLWTNYLFTDFRDDDNDDTLSDATDTTHAVDTRLWWRAILRPPADSGTGREHSLYLRLKGKSTWRDPSDSNGTYDYNGPHVDYAYLSLDFRPSWLQIGRRLYGIGEGIAYSNVHDGVELAVAGATWSLMGLATRTLPHEDNLDLSVPGGKKSGRTFYGVEGRYLGIPNRGVYGYFLLQRDDHEEHPEDQGQDFDYQSAYCGLGSEGTAITNLRYATELIAEIGESFSSRTNERRGIKAWAADTSLTYDVQLPMQPTLSAEYAFGSGDADRTNVTDTLDGNTAGEDTNFLYFGYLPTGYALAPRLSNLHMIKGGLSLKPLERAPFLKEFTASAEVYQFYKHESRGGIFDAEATENHRDIGSELDLTLSWPVLSDLTLAIEYGHFIPSEAYSVAADDSTDYFSVSVTSTF